MENKKYVDNHINRTKIENTKGLIKGFNGKTFSSIFFLLKTYLKRQKAIAIFIIIMSAWMVSMSFALAIGNQQGVVNSMVIEDLKSILLITTTIPIMIICLFSIPLTLTRIQSSTMIKRIGATRTGEKAYILIVWINYLIISLVLFSILFLLEFIMFSYYFGTVYGMREVLLYGLYSIIYIIMLVSIGTLIGILPSGVGTKTFISLLLLIYYLIFGNVFYPMTSAIQGLAPVTTTIMINLNPITMVSYISSKLIIGQEPTNIILYGVFYSIIISLSSLMLAMSLMSFNKIR